MHPSSTAPTKTSGHALRARHLIFSVTIAALLSIDFWTELHAASETLPAPQQFLQESADKFGTTHGLPEGPVQLIECDASGRPRAFARGAWFEFADQKWTAMPGLTAGSDSEFPLLDQNRNAIKLPLPWKDVIQVLRQGNRLWVATAGDPYTVSNGRHESMGWPSRFAVNQIAADKEGALLVASSAGLFQQGREGWNPVRITDGLGRAWAVSDVLGVAFDAQDRLWFAVKAGVGCREAGGWKFHDASGGLPWNEFTGIAADPAGPVCFGTRRGLVRFDGVEWQYRQGPRWLPHDEVRQIACAPNGDLWTATAAGAGRIARRPMRFHEKAALYESQIERHIKRTPFGYVAEAPLQRTADPGSANPQDSDNDGLWTAMYGAGECFLYAATRDPASLTRARQAFEALRFLQKVTQGGPHAPPKGYIARTIRPVEWPDPNVGRLDRDREEQKGDRLWKVYEPRWPRSADGKWYWKGDTSSDELDGHYFFYPLYYEFCANTEAEKERVREVVRDITDHLMTHDFTLIDHDGRATRWGVYGPQSVNRDPYWWQERGLNSLSMLAYLSAAHFVTGDSKYDAAARTLVEQHGFGQNLMFPKVQQGPGSGNQSDDEMAFMCYYTLLRCSTNDALKNQVRLSFFRYWLNEIPEMNPFFNFAYAAQNRDATAGTVWGPVPLQPAAQWLDDSLATLRGFSLDRLDWPHQNSHRLDLQLLGRVKARDVFDARRESRGHRIDGRVIPVENRHFNHWNTDPWHLDYGGNGNELASGTVFLLPYYMGLYHGFIAKP